MKTTGMAKSLKVVGMGLLALTLSMGLPGCFFGDSGDWDPYCNPTGHAMGGSGVYIGPEGCEEVTLYALNDTPDNATWVLFVSWPMHGEHPVLELYNRTTNSSETEVLYLFDPSFTLFMGEDYPYGFRMAEGDNEIEYLIYTDEQDAQGNIVRNVIEEGEFTLQVTHTDEPAQ